MNTDVRKSVVGQVLLDWALLDEETLDSALSESETEGIALEQILVRRRLIDPGSIAQVVTEAAWRQSDTPLLRRYRIDGMLGRGGVAVVYRAFDLNMDREVALKVIRAGGTDSNRRQRFIRESKAVGRLQHPNVITVYDVGIDADCMYLVMEVIDGEGLDDLLKRGIPDREFAVAVMEKVCRAVDYAHETGIIHRDLKPGNVMITSKGRPVVTDFGLARFEDPEQSSLTNEGSVVGTPAYMAPEQVRGMVEKISNRTDIYALGCVLFEVLTGRRAHPGRTAIEVYHHIVHSSVEPLRSIDPTIPPPLEKLVLEAMDPDPDQRIASAAEIADRLAILLDCGLHVAPSAGTRAIAPSPAAPPPTPFAPSPPSTVDDGSMAPPPPGAGPEVTTLGQPGHVPLTVSETSLPAGPPSVQPLPVHPAPIGHLALQPTVGPVDHLGPLPDDPTAATLPASQALDPGVAWPPGEGHGSTGPLPAVTPASSKVWWIAGGLGGALALILVLALALGGRGSDAPTDDAGNAEAAQLLGTARDFDRAHAEDPAAFDRAIETYEEIIERYPDSMAAIECRMAIKEVEVRRARIQERRIAELDAAADARIAAGDHAGALAVHDGAAADFVGPAWTSQLEKAEASVVGRIVAELDRALLPVEMAVVLDPIEDPAAIEADVARIRALIPGRIGPAARPIERRLTEVETRLEAHEARKEERLRLKLSEIDSRIDRMELAELVASETFLGDCETDDALLRGTIESVRRRVSARRPVVERRTAALAFELLSQGQTGEARQLLSNLEGGDAGRIDGHVRRLEAARLSMWKHLSTGDVAAARAAWDDLRGRRPEADLLPPGLRGEVRYPYDGERWPAERYDEIARSVDRFFEGRIGRSAVSLHFRRAGEDSRTAHAVRGEGRGYSVKSASGNWEEFVPMTGIAVDDLLAIAGGDRLESDIVAATDLPADDRVLLRLVRGDVEDARRALSGVDEPERRRIEGWIDLLASAGSPDRDPDPGSDPPPRSDDPPPRADDPPHRDARQRLEEVFGKKATIEPLQDGLVRVEFEVDLRDQGKAEAVFESGAKFELRSGTMRLQGGSPGGPGGQGGPGGGPRGPGGGQQGPGGGQQGPGGQNGGPPSPESLRFRGTWVGEFRIEVSARLDDQAMFGVSYFGYAVVRIKGPSGSPEFVLHEGQPGPGNAPKDKETISSSSSYDLEASLAEGEHQHTLRGGSKRWTLSLRGGEDRGSLGLLHAGDVVVTKIRVAGVLDPASLER